MSRRFTPTPRPYLLEVLKEDLLGDGEEWEVWSSYARLENAEHRLETLSSKGYTVRIVTDETALPEDPALVCSLCDESHNGPYDGSCLL